MTDDPMKPVVEICVDIDDSGVKFTPRSALWRKTADYPDGCFVFARPPEVKKDKAHFVTFVLKDNTGRGLQFPGNAKDAIWVVKHKNKQAPPARDNTDYSVISPANASGDVLKVWNKNLEVGAWKFTLNFIDRDGEAAEPWDPIIQNTDGGIPFL